MAIMRDSTTARDANIVITNLKKAPASSRSPAIQ